MNSILPGNRPAITALIYERDIQKIKNEIKAVTEQGADIVGLMLEGYDVQCHSEKGMKTLIESAQGKPIYITDYLRGNINKNVTDEDIHDELMLFLELSKGKSRVIADVRTDMYDPAIREITLNEKAIEKHIKFIKEIHDNGGKVLMSSHVFDEVLSAEDVIFIAKEQQRRGADIAKIVTVAKTEEDLFLNYEISLKLRKKLDIPYLFLCGGEFCYKHRRLSAPLGSCMVLARENTLTGQIQPTVSEAIEVLKCLGYYNKSKDIKKKG